MLTTAGAFCILSSCGASSGDGAEENSCGLTLVPTAELDAIEGQKKYSFAATLPESCLKKTTERTGKTLVKLSAQASQPNQDVVLDELTAGQRNLKFDSSSDNLRRGSFEKSFDSSLLPDWSVPWSDKPTNMTLILLAPTSVAAASIPKSISVELRF
jgi:hypothetical protein